jgi:hypothetical protein
MITRATFQKVGSEQDSMFKENVKMIENKVSLYKGIAQIMMVGIFQSRKRLKIGLAIGLVFSLVCNPD